MLYVYVIGSCGSVGFAGFYCLLYLGCGYGKGWINSHFVCYPVYFSVFFLCFMFCDVGEFWLKAVAMSFAVDLGLLLKEIVRYACCEGFLLLRLDIRFQSLWVFVLWSQFSFSFSFQMFVL